MVNYDVPVERDSRKPAFETYLHRIGRSGRFGRRGAAFNLVNGAQVSLRNILPTRTETIACHLSAFATAGMMQVLALCMQEESLVQAISNYFQRSIPEVPFDDETKFVEVLKEAGLTDG